MTDTQTPTFQEIIDRLSRYWAEKGCIIHHGYDLELGAGTFNPATMLRCLGPEPYRAAYVEPSRRPTDGRYGENPNRLQHYFQYQVVLKPSPLNIQDLYLRSLEAIGLDLSQHDIRFVHDDWEAPTLGAWGLGWEVWIDGMEITQFTYFQCVGSTNLSPITGELTYGIERIAMYLQNVDSIYDLRWNEVMSYGDIYQRSEFEWSHYNFEKATTDMWFRHFDDFEKEAEQLIAQNLPIPAYDFVMKASHAFNLLDARGVISVTERTGYIARMRNLSRMITDEHLATREKLGYPLIGKFPPNGEELPEAPILEDADFDPQEKADYILEIGSEELPATFVPIGCANLQKAMEKLLASEKLSYSTLEVYGTPRRLAVFIRDLARGTEPKSEERRGPALQAAFDEKGQPTKAGEGFLRSVGHETATLESIRTNQIPGIEIRTIKNTEYLFSCSCKKGRSAKRILSEKLPQLILDLDFPKKMRWSTLDIAFARPLRWILSLHGTESIPFLVGNIVADNHSSGHPQLDPGLFALENAADYVETLKQHHIMVDIAERQAHIESQLQKLEKTLSGSALAREKLLSQVLHLVEWPMLTSATFDPAFLKCPKEVLISEMVEHQKYYPVANADGTLQNHFIIVANNTPTDQIRKGNQKVLSARLSDGTFLYEQDLKVSLTEWNEKLKHVTFQKALGSVFEKVQRLEGHVSCLYKALEKVNPKRNLGDLTKTQRTALLCKADLASELVKEFPELQGVIGSHYALYHGESPDVAQAIDEHWMPRGDKAPLPQSMTGIIVSLADKIDNILSCFLVGLKPTSSSDPYALRRQVLGIIRILLKHELYLPLAQAIRSCSALFGQENKAEILEEIQQFITNRIKTVFQERGLAKDEIEASLSAGFNDIYETYCKIQALHHFRLTNDKFGPLYEVFKRAKGQLEGQEKRPFSCKLLQEDAEIALDTALEATTEGFETALSKHEYDKAYEMLANLQPALARLFDEVRILHDDAQLRHNRIALLQRVFSLFGRLLDFSKIREKALKQKVSKAKGPCLH